MEEGVAVWPQMRQTGWTWGAGGNSGVPVIGLRKISVSDRSTFKNEDVTGGLIYAFSVLAQLLLREAPILAHHQHGHGHPMAAIFIND